MPPKMTQKDIHCNTNSDGNTVEKEATNKDPGKAVDDALSHAKTAASGERTTFLAFHCPTKSETNDCQWKTAIKGDADDDLVPAVIEVKYDKVKKVWVAKCSYTWAASFDCVKDKPK